MPIDQTLPHDEVRRRRLIGAIVNGPINRIVRDMPVDVADYWVGEEGSRELESALRAVLIPASQYLKLPGPYSQTPDQRGVVLQVVA